MSSKPARESLFYGGAVAAVLLLGWFLYEPAFNSVFLLDDRPNLHRLTSVTDMESALFFMFSGTAGPIGRPLALATFLPQAGLWELSAAPFLIVNVLLHLLNGLLIYYFFRQLSIARRLDGSDSQLVAIAAMALWLLAPLLASSSLMVIQRMTTLSATFMLVGLNAYLYARARIGERPGLALAGMGAALILATVLAVLAKENGALLPSLVLVLEATLLNRPHKVSTGVWRTWLSLFLLAPTLLIAGFLISKIPYGESLVLRKDFTAWERLLTEARVLWEYLLNAFIARPAQYGPFQDGYPVADSLTDPVTLAAVLAWIIAVAGAVVLRRKYPIAAFAVLWYVTGHSLESTTLPLYLYFEHRNYVPLMGPMYAICYLVLSASGGYRNLARVTLPIYILVNAGVLYSVTSLWGNPLMAANYWHMNSPKSVSGVGHLATQQMKEMGPSVGLMTLSEYAHRHPQHAYLRLPELTMTCRGAPTRDQSSTVEYLMNELPSVDFTYTVGTMLDELLFAVTNGNCNGVDRAVGRELALAIISNPRYKNNDTYRSYHHQLMARIALDNGDTEEVMRELALARASSRGDRVDMMYVSVLAGEQRFDDARDYIDRASGELPIHPLRRYASEINLRQLQRYVDELERRAHDYENASGETLQALQE